jgi:hypothetical protein
MLAAASGDEKQATMFSRPQASIDSMNANNPILQTLASIPVPANIPAHSIIDGDGPIEERDDGVVTYKSAHIETKRFPIWKCVGDPVRINLKPLRKSGAHCWNISPR